MKLRLIVKILQYYYFHLSFRSRNTAEHSVCVVSVDQACTTQNIFCFPWDFVCMCLFLCTYLFAKYFHISKNTWCCTLLLHGSWASVLQFAQCTDKVHCQFIKIPVNMDMEQINFYGSYLSTSMIRKHLDIAKRP